MIKMLKEMKDMTILDMQLSIKSTLKQERAEELAAFAQQIVDAM